MAHPLDLDEPFPADALRDRLGIVQADLRSQGFAAGVLGDPENIFWLTGYRSIGYFTFQTLVVPQRGAPVLVTRVVNGAIGRATRSIGRCVLIGDSDDPVSVLVETLHGLVERQGTIGVETSARAVAACDVRAIEAQRVWQIADWNGTCELQRRRKSPEQLAMMHHAARAAVAGLDAAVQAVRPGATENDVAAEMLAAATRAGSEFFRVPLVVTGPATALCFTTWERRSVCAGDVVLLESAACVHRHHAVIGRTAVVGRPLPEHRRVADALLAMLESGLEALRPGVTSGEVHAAAQRQLVAAGLQGKVPQRLAYAVGIGFPPNWAEGHFLALRAGDRTVIEPGMTFHMIPSLFTDTFGMWFSETVAVTERGSEVLTRHPRTLIEIDPTNFPTRSLK